MHLFSKRRIINLPKYAVLAIIVLLFIYSLSSNLFLKYSHNSKCSLTKQGCQSSHSSSQQLEHRNVRLQYDNITLAVTICGSSSFVQGLNALKSALILSKAHLHFVIMTDQELFKPISEKLKTMQTNQNKFSYQLHLVEYPNINRNSSGIWRKLFKECASQRLFFPAIFPNLDSLLYVDTDILFLSPVEEIWSHFYKMNSSQIAGMSYESADFSSNWYHRFAKHPYYGSFGLNSGVMLMNLTRMRSFGWNEKLEPILLKYQTKIVWGDQDIINIIFHFNPDKVLLFGCHWNYRTDYCVYSLFCKIAEKEGIKIVHGNRGVFLRDNQPQFRALFVAFEQYDFGQHKLIDLVKMTKNLISSSANRTNCAKISHLFWESMEKLLR